MRGESSYDRRVNACTSAEPLRQRLINGDGLEELAGFPGCSVDAIVTDVPYAATGSASSYVTREGGIPREYQFYESWLREHLTEWRRVLKPSGAIWTTIDWRGAVSLERAAARLGLPEPKIGVWYRRGLGMGHVLRNVYECFAVLTMPKWERIHTNEPDVWDIEWSPSSRKHGHSAEKPTSLMARACRLLCRPGAVIADPFMGSGSTGVAAVGEGMHFLGIEREADFYATAVVRVADAVRMRDMAEPATLPACLPVEGEAGRQCGLFD